MRRLLTGLLGAWLLISACGGDDDDGDRAAVTSIPEDTTSTSTTTTAPETVAPDVIPQDEALITEEYVEQVLNALYEVSLEALIATRQEGLVDTPAIERIEATSSQAVVAQRINDLADLAAAGFTGIKAEPTPMVIRVIDVLEASTTCVISEVTTDPSGLLESPPEENPDVRDFVRIYAASDEQRASELNPTAWVIDEFPITQDGSIPELRCGS